MYIESRCIEIPNQRVDTALFWLLSYFRDAKKEIYLVGGSVRDLLLDKEPKDYDLCTNATPEEVKKILGTSGRYTFIDTGLKHGTVTIHDISADLFFEVTAYRLDGIYSDNRHPDEVTFTPSLEEDLKRRDFTINSFAYNPIEKQLVMLDKSFLDDLKLGIIRTVGEPTQRFEEDALRMLRAFRFAAQLGFTVDKDTYKAIKECAPLLSKISKERIRDELTKILLSDNPRYLEFIAITGLEEYAFGGHPLMNMLMCEHQNPYHYTDVFHHTLDVVERVPKDFELRWAALFHDVGKPLVKKLKPGTTDHYRYIGHPEISVNIATDIMQTLKFSNEQVNSITKLVKYHDIELADCKMSTFKKYLAEIGTDLFMKLMKLRIADSSAHQVYLESKFAIDAVSVAYDRFSKVINEHQPLYLKDLKVNGDDMKELGFENRQIGEVLDYLLNLTYGHPDYNEKEKLMKLAKGFLDKSNQDNYNIE